MEPVDIVYRNREAVNVLEELRGRIFTHIADFTIAYSPSDEPVPYEEKDKLTYVPLKKGQIWGGLYSCAWIRVDADIPERDGELVAHIDIGGEGLVYERYGKKDPVGAITHDASFIDRLQAMEAKTYIPLPVPHPEHVAWDIDAGYNGTYNYLKGHGRIYASEILSVDREGKAFYYDYLTAACLMMTGRDDVKPLLAEALSRSFSSWSEGRKVLSPLFNGIPDTSLTLSCIGHSHLDLAWLWPVRETRRKAARTFTHQLANLSRYEEYVYGASQPQQFEFVKEDCPMLYEKIKRSVAEGRFEPQGAMWVEADCNIPSGEALIRQLTVGQEFWRKEFGVRQRICWLPDVFGYNGNLPQLLKKAGVDYFLTIKLSWNEHNPFPHRSFVWRGIDSSEVLVHMPPAETYNAAASPLCAAQAKEHFPELGLSDKAILLYGIGDGGGGPGEAHIEMMVRQKSLSGSPVMKASSAEEFFLSLEEDRPRLPVCTGELYLEKHQGTYTTQAFSKWADRRCTEGLKTAEELSLLMDDYPSEELDALWKRVLFLEFHDILPGASIHRVYEESRREYEDILSSIRGLCRKALEEEGEKRVYNPSPFERDYFFRDGGWKKVHLPSHGSALPFASSDGIKRDGRTFSDSRITVTFSDDGLITSVKCLGREWCRGEMGRLVIWNDPPLHYNAWDIDWEYHRGKCMRLSPYESEVFEDGPFSGVINRYAFSGSTIEQHIVLVPSSGALYFNTHVNWHEKDAMLRCEFYPCAFSDEVICEIQNGEIRRSTRDDTPQEKAQFEICAQRYVTLCDDEYGFSLINDSKYGHRVKNGMISLNLLRSSSYPDESADMGEHEFVYAIVPHRADDRLTAVKLAHNLNRLPVLYRGRDHEPPVHVSGDVIVDSIKKSLNGNGIVVRMYEPLGKHCTVSLDASFSYSSVHECTLLEEITSKADTGALHFTPYETKSLIFLR
ncbi:MAG: alpha-mannosidase [Bullifex sp.]